MSIHVRYLIYFLIMKFKLFIFLSLFAYIASPALADKGNKEISFYTGTFDVIDKEGDDQTSLFGIEHKNPNLFRDTFLGKFSPVSGGFMTGNNSIYLYTGVEAQYGVGPLKILPSFTPGYYEKGNGKDLGSALEFKSEIKLGLDIFESSNIGYSYSHISNNEWGETNPGTDNQQITFSKNF
jgi:lipid A 3-O-deacylase